MSEYGDEPRIYVACLASYNAGILHGEWIEATQDLEEIREQVTDMLAKSPDLFAEEYAIHDYENFDGLQIREYESLEDVQAAAEFLLEQPELGAALMNYYGGLNAVEEAREAIESNYSGCFNDLAHWAQSYLGETGALAGLSESLQGYFDFSSYGEDVELSGDIIVIPVRNQIHVLWSR